MPSTERAARNTRPRASGGRGAGGRETWPPAWRGPTGVDVFVQDLGSGTILGPFPSGTKIKYTQAPGGTPSSKKTGSDTGQAGAVQFHIIGTGDAFVFPTGEPQHGVTCLVPPPPK